VLITPFRFGAGVVRILQDFAGIRRVNRWILFVFRVREGTLDQHIGVRIPGGQPNQLALIGLKVKAKVDPNSYPGGIKVSQADLESVQLRPDSFHGDWNYTILPHMSVLSKS
jgi:Rhodopirellula transposase DDE domain